MWPFPLLHILTHKVAKPFSSYAKYGSNNLSKFKFESASVIFGFFIQDENCAYALQYAVGTVDFFFQ